MKAGNFVKRLGNLEQEANHTPVEIELLWADPDEDPSKDGPDVIRLKWSDELEKRY